ncbi:MAG: hypothetical protein JNJ54_35635 [Myxococcaceae bacterium]|nr:hypothetical protein [Myxococcaceae bacterium]
MGALMGAGAKTQQADLKRMMLRLSALDGVPWRTAEGLRLLHVSRVRDPVGLLEAGPVPKTAALVKCLELARPPVELSDRWLGAAQRDLKILRTTPGLLKAIAESPRTFRRYGAIDRAWLSARQRALDALSALGNAPPGPADRFAVVRAVRGDVVAARLEGWFQRSQAVGQQVRAERRRRLDGLLAALSGSPAVPEVPFEVHARTVEALRAAERRPGRAFARVVRRLVQEYLAWPDPAHAAAEPGEPFEARGLRAAVSEAAERFFTTLPSTRTPQALGRVERALSLAGLTCDVEDDGALTPADVTLLLRHLGRPGLEVAGARVRDLVGVLRLGLEGPELGAALAVLSAGVPDSTIQALVETKQLSRAFEVAGDRAALASWAAWVAAVGRPLAARGVTLELPPRLFASRDGDVRAFADVLLARGAPQLEPSALLESLDAMVALSKRAPGSLRRLRERLVEVTPGLASRHAPDFTRWLGDEALLDRHFTLKQLVGEPLEISRTLRRDFEAHEKRARELEHLKGRTQLSPAQHTRLARLEARDGDDASPAWTVRQLTQRNAALEARALEVLLDEALREALSKGWGLTVSTRGRLPVAWRDALRFLLTTRHNAGLLQVVLRHAAAHPGQPMARALPKNVAWLTRAKAHLDVDAWLAPRTTTVTLGDRTLTLSIEHDPLEALRMGIPFGTCLSLTDGSNAGAAVLNAMEANKRVLYLRDQRGAIVGRKLIVISRDWKLLGYRTYSALEREVQPAIEQAFEAFCQSIATDAKVPLGDGGAPENLHEGFWYDDGLVPFGGLRGGLVEDYCRSLGRPPFSCHGLEREAQAVAVRARGDVDAALGLVNHWSLEGETAALAEWVLEQLGEARAVRAASSAWVLGELLLERAARSGPKAMLAMFVRLDRHGGHRWRELLERVPSPGRARLLVDAARARCGKAPHFDDHDIEHGTIWLLPTLLADEPVSLTFELLERIEPVWQYVIDSSAQCRDCVEGAVEHLTAVAADQYARRPEPQAVIEALGSSNPHVVRLALSLAARFPFPRGRNDEAPGCSGFSRFEGAPLGCPAAVRALRALWKRQPALEDDPRLLAALLRQSGPGVETGVLPRPDTPPFEALADLQLHLPELTAELASSWPEPIAKPGPWELAFHRRHETPWRLALRRANPTDLGAATWRALLGENEPDLTRADRREVSSEPAPPALARSELAPISRAVRAQLAGQDTSLRLVGEAIDVIAVAGRVRRLAQAVERRDEAAALSVCASLSGSTLTWRDWRAMTAQAVERGLSDAVVTALAEQWIPGCSWGMPELAFPLVARVARIPGVRAVLVPPLSRLSPDRLLVVHAQLTALLPAEGLEALLDEWLRAWLRADKDVLGDVGLDLEPSLRARLERLALEDVTTAVQLFLRQPGFRRASEQLGDLARRFPHDALRAALQTERDDDDLGCRKAWLLAELDALKGP